MMVLQRLAIKTRYRYRLQNDLPKHQPIMSILRLPSAEVHHVDLLGDIKVIGLPCQQKRFQQDTILMS